MGTVATPLLLKALDNYAAVFQPLVVTPVVWNSKDKKLIYVSKRTTLFLWFLKATSAVCLGAISYIYLLVKQFLVRDGRVPLFNLLVIGGILIPLLFTILISVGLSLFGESYVLFWNQLRRLETIIQNDLKRINPFLRSSATEVKKSIDVFGIFMITLSNTLILYSFVVPIGLTFLQLDPYHYIIQDLFPSETDSPDNFLDLKTCITVTFRITLLFLAARELCRILALVFMITISGFRMTLNCVMMMRQYHNKNWQGGRKSLLHLIRRHNQLFLLHVMSRKFQSLNAFALMGVGISLSALYGFCTIRTYSIIPIVFYLYFPSVVVVIIIATQLTVPTQVELYIKSKDLLRIFDATSNLLTKVEKLYTRKVIKALRPVMILAGVGELTLFGMKQSTKRTYYWAMVSYTISLLLAFSQTMIEKPFQKS